MQVSDLRSLGTIIKCKNHSLIFRVYIFADTFIKDFQPSDKLDNPYLIIHDNSEHLCTLLSRTCLRVLGTLLYMHEHCPYITYYCFFCQSFIITLQKCQPSPQIYSISYCNIVILIIRYQFKLCLYIFCTTLKGFIFRRKHYYKRKITLPNS